MYPHFSESTIQMKEGEYYNIFSECCFCSTFIDYTWLVITMRYVDICDTRYGPFEALNLATGLTVAWRGSRDEKST